MGDSTLGLFNNDTTTLHLFAPTKGPFPGQKVLILLYYL
jgi:hypothetical protein